MNAVMNHAFDSWRGLHDERRKQHTSGHEKTLMSYVWQTRSYCQYQPRSTGKRLLIRVQSQPLGFNGPFS